MKVLDKPEIEQIEQVETQEKPEQAERKRRLIRHADNAMIFDEIEGRMWDYLDPDKYTPEQLGRLRRYQKNMYQSIMIYIVKRDRHGNITPITPPSGPGEITPEMAGDALEDPSSAEVFSNPSSWVDVLSDFKFPIIIGVLTLAIFLLAFTFTDPQTTLKSIPIPGISP